MTSGRAILLLAVVTALLTMGIIFVFENREKFFQPSRDILTEPENVRSPAVAGTFYPGNQKELSAQIDQLLANTTKTFTRLNASAFGGPKILLVPHAGYEYSGAVAAHAFAEIKDRDYATVVLIGNSHHYGFAGAAVYDQGVWETPLGQVPIDETLAQKLLKESPQIFAGRQYHDQEHSLEVEIPFLQRTLKDFQILPIILSDATTETATALANALAKHLDPYTLVVVSSDLSHYPSYEDAKKSDQQIIESMVGNDLEKFSELSETLPQSGIPNLQTAACGAGAIKTALILSEKLGITNIQLLNSANSGDLPEADKSRVVGYAAIVFYTDRSGAELTDDEKKELLEISRETLDTFLTTGQTPAIDVENKFLENPLGAFVTLRKNGALRGCIGSFEPEKPLWEVVQEMTIAAATQDRRFPPVQSNELEDIKIEISVLSPRREIADPQKIVMGKHGVTLVRGDRQGVFLPQVATENNWDLQTLLGQLCTQKMGLSANCWQDPQTQISVFTAEVFAE